MPRGTTAKTQKRARPAEKKQPIILGGALARKRAASSNFHLVINTNIRENQLNEMPRNERRQFEASLKKVPILLRKQFQGGKFMFGNRDGKTPKVKDMGFHREVAPNTGCIHIDGYVLFDDFTKVDGKGIQQFATKHLSPWCKGAYCNFRFFKDEMAIVRSYAAKDGVKLM